mmetsp:Transcript_16056/g.51425  ORF Transcript_16056/g.51425 Transcript_16056/m.51425 type:complete len:286 (-) Transcript_16056:86-943(-)
MSGADEATSSKSPAGRHRRGLTVTPDDLLQQLPGAVDALRVPRRGAEGERLLGGQQRLISPVLAVVCLGERQRGGPGHAHVLQGPEERVRLQREPAGLAALLREEVGVGGEIHREGLGRLILDLSREVEGLHGHLRRLSGGALDHAEVRASGLPGARLHAGLRLGDVGLRQHLECIHLKPLQLQTLQGYPAQTPDRCSRHQCLIGLRPCSVGPRGRKRCQRLASSVACHCGGLAGSLRRAQRGLKVTRSRVGLRGRQQVPHRLPGGLPAGLPRQAVSSCLRRALP